MTLPQKYLCQTLLLLNAGAVCAADLWVSPQGNDTCSGNQNAPVATLRMALQKVREARRLMPDTSPANGFHVVMRGGSYLLDEPIFIRPEDAGTENSPTIIEAARGEKPVVSGGVVVDKWSKVAGQSKLWVADAPTFGGRPFDFRQLWVNGKKAIRARSVNKLDEMPHILGANKRAEELYIRTPQQGKLDSPAPMEMLLHQMWEIAVLRVKSMTVRGDTTTVKFFQPESRIEFQHPWPPLVLQHDSLGGNSTYFLCNAIEFLDAPGEWFYDAHNGKLYYYPRSDEDMRTASVVAPYFESILRIEGTPDRQPHHIELRGIGFAHSTWLRPSLQGHVPLQAGMFLVDAYKLRPAGTHERPKLENQAWTEPMPGGVSVKNAHHIRFFRCTFEHFAAAGLELVEGTHHNTIEGCTFRDMGGSGLQIGSFGELAYEDHLAFAPADERVLCRHERIANNLIDDCANEDWGTVGIAAGFVRDVCIEHNEVRNVSYTGISLGWGWNKAVNAMRNNRIHANHVHHYARYMYDVAAIYTLSAQPNTSITENYVHDIFSPAYVHDRKHWFYLYTDEGSAYITVRDNWCPAEKFLQNANGPGNTWENNGPQVSGDIVKRAGLEENFKDLLN